MLFNRRNKLEKSGRAGLDIRITLNRKAYYIGTGIKIFKEHWDEQAERVNKKCPDWFEYNQVLENFLKLTNQYLIARINDPNSARIEDIQALLGKRSIDKGDFMQFADEEIRNREDIKQVTKNNHLSQLSLLKLFSPSGVRFSQMDYAWVESFDKYMLKLSMSHNTRWKYHKFIKTYLNMAIKRGLAIEYPYKDFKVAKKDGNRDALTLQELKELEEMDRARLSPTQTETLDKFLFSCYTGLRISDIHTLTNDSFFVDEDRIYMTIEQIKSERMVRNMPLHKLFNGKAIVIYNKYKNDREDLLFPVRSNGEVNKHLKKVAHFANIKRNLTFHMARHTFGTALAEITGNVMLIKELMGHAKVETSMTYIHMSKKRIENTLDRFNFDY